MPEAILLVLVLGACYLGFALLALSQDRNWELVTGQRDVPAGRAVALRIAGYGLLAAALPLALALARDGASFGSILWGVGLSFAALATVATLTWRPAWLKPLARLAATGRARRQGA